MNSGQEILQAMLLGKVEALHPETLFLFSRTGLIHLFSASGFHMASAQLLARLALRPIVFLPNSTHRWFRFLLPVVFFLYFGALTGWSSPLIRALSFALLLEVAKLAESPTSAWRLFCYSGFLAFLFGNSSLLSLALSLLGMAGILLAPNRSLFTVAIWPWLFTAPLVIWYFQLFSMAAPLWNLTFGLLWSFTLLPLAIVTLLLQEFGVPHWWLSTANAHCMEFTLRLLQFCESKIDLALWVHPFHFLLAVVTALLLFHWRKPWIALAGVLALLFVRFTSALILLDVGQGDALVMKAQTGEILLVDTGRGNANYSSGAKALERMGIGQIDHLLLTHLDADHVGGLPLLLLRHPVQNVWIRREFSQDPKWKKVAPFLVHSQLRYYEEEQPPSTNCRLPPPISKNESSPFCRITLVSGETLFSTGDAGFPGENWLLRNSPDFLEPVTYLKLGHHGSRHSTSVEFLATLRPKTALLSVGKKNFYGHPHRDLLDRLTKLEVIRTDRGGSWTFTKAFPLPEHIYFGLVSEDNTRPGGKLRASFLK
jgi:competence protein ComEC